MATGHKAPPRPQATRRHHEVPSARHPAGPLSGLDYRTSGAKRLFTLHTPVVIARAAPPHTRRSSHCRTLHAARHRRATERLVYTGAACESAAAHACARRVNERPCLALVNKSIFGLARLLALAAGLAHWRTHRSCVHSFSTPLWYCFTRSHRYSHCCTQLCTDKQ